MEELPNQDNFNKAKTPLKTNEKDIKHLPTSRAVKLMTVSLMQCQIPSIRLLQSTRTSQSESIRKLTV